jgi:mediator of RNA polymerase II transcription subunit 31
MPPSPYPPRPNSAHYNQHMMSQAPTPHQHHHMQQQQPPPHQTSLQMPGTPGMALHHQQSHLQQPQHQQPTIDLELLEQQEKERERERERLEKEKREKEQREHEERKRLRKEKERERFLVELEFVQSLANPDYLAHLCRQGVFEQASFRNYLRYLLYWKSPEYIGFIRYPQCLFFLDMLTQRDETNVYHAIQAIRRNRTLIAEQQLRHWKLQGANLANSTSPFEERKIANASKKTKKT